MDKSRKVILIADDETGMRDMLGWCLQDSEFDIVAARDGAEAVELISAGGIDLVVSDITMPHLGGFDVLGAAMRTRPRTPVIMITGFGTVEMAVYAMRQGASDFLLKPFDVRHLAARIHETLLAALPEGVTP